MLDSMVQNPSDTNASQVQAAGVGIVFVERQGGTINVITTTRGGSAEKAGTVKPGDTVISVDGQNVKGMGLEQVKGLVMGPEGTMVSMVFVRREKQGPSGVAKDVMLPIELERKLPAGASSPQDVGRAAQLEREVEKLRDRTKTLQGQLASAQQTIIQRDRQARQQVPDMQKVPTQAPSQNSDDPTDALYARLREVTKQLDDVKGRSVKDAAARDAISKQLTAEKRRVDELQSALDDQRRKNKELAIGGSDSALQMQKEISMLQQALTRARLSNEQLSEQNETWRNRFEDAVQEGKLLDVAAKHRLAKAQEELDRLRQEAAEAKVLVTQEKEISSSLRNKLRDAASAMEALNSDRNTKAEEGRRVEDEIEKIKSDNFHLQRALEQERAAVRSLEQRLGSAEKQAEGSRSAHEASQQAKDVADLAEHRAMELEAAIRRKDTQLSAAEGRVKELDATCKELQSLYERSQDRSRNLENQAHISHNDTAIKENSALKLEVTELQRQLERARLDTASNQSRKHGESELQRLLEEAEGRIAELQLMIQNMRQDFDCERKQLLAKIASLEKRLEQLSSLQRDADQVDGLRAEVAALTDERNSMKDKGGRSGQRVLELSTEIRELKAKLAQTTTNNNTLTEENSELASRISSVKGLSATTAAELEHLKLLLAKEKSTCDSLRTSLRESQRRVNDVEGKHEGLVCRNTILTGQIDELQALIGAMQSQSNGSEESRNRIEQSLAKAKAEIQSLSIRLKQSEDRNQDLQGKIGQLNSDAAASDRQASDASHRLRQLEVEFDNSKESEADLRRHAEQAISERTRAFAELQGAQQKLESLSEDLLSVRHQKQEALQRLEEFQKENDLLQRKITELEGKLHNAAVAAADFESSAGAKERQLLSSIHGLQQDLEQEQRRLQVMADQLKNERAVNADLTERVGKGRNAREDRSALQSLREAKSQAERRADVAERRADEAEISVHELRSEISSLQSQAEYSSKRLTQLESELQRKLEEENHKAKAGLQSSASIEALQTQIEHSAKTVFDLESRLNQLQGRLLEERNDNTKLRSQLAESISQRDHLQVVISQFQESAVGQQQNNHSRKKLQILEEENASLRLAIAEADNLIQAQGEPPVSNGNIANPSASNIKGLVERAEIAERRSRDLAGQLESTQVKLNAAQLTLRELSHSHKSNMGALMPSVGEESKANSVPTRIPSEPTGVGLLLTSETPKAHDEQQGGDKFSYRHVVSAVVEGQAAAKDGTITKGDILLAVNGQEARFIPLAQVKNAIVGPSGSSVELTLARCIQNSSGAANVQQPSSLSEYQQYSVLLRRGDRKTVSAPPAKFDMRASANEMLNSKDAFNPVATTVTARSKPSHFRGEAQAAMM